MSSSFAAISWKWSIDKGLKSVPQEGRAIKLIFTFLVLVVVLVFFGENERVSDSSAKRGNLSPYGLQTERAESVNEVGKEVRAVVAAQRGLKGRAESAGYNGGGRRQHNDLVCLCRHEGGRLLPLADLLGELLQIFHALHNLGQ